MCEANNPKLNNLNNLNNLNDDVLTSEIKAGSAGSEEAFKVLAEKYDSIISYNLSRITIPAGASKWSDKEDLYQECRIVLYKAAKRYDSLKNVKFSTYANACIKNYLASFFRKYGEAETHASLEDIPENELSSFDVYDFSEFDDMFEILTSFERQVFLMYIERKSYKHIAEILNKNVKSIDNAVFRIKNKLKPYADNFINI
jgi:RNA polymerase sporulation-specific sigma factor